MEFEFCFVVEFDMFYTQFIGGKFTSIVDFQQIASILIAWFKSERWNRLSEKEQRVFHHYIHTHFYSMFRATVGHMMLRNFQFVMTFQG